MRSRAFFAVLGAIFAFTATGAVAANYGAENTPETGYVLCVSKSTKQVTFPGKLTCPKGTTALEMGAQGAEGPQGWIGPTGPQGPAGPAAPASPLYAASIPSTDIVADGYISSGSQMVKKVLFAIAANPTTSAMNEFDAYISGTWAGSTRLDSLIDCYFQGQSAYLGKTGRSFWGSASDQYTSWNSFDLHVHATSWSKIENEPLLLICQTSGSVKDVSGFIYGKAAGTWTTLPSAPIPQG